MIPVELTPGKTVYGFQYNKDIFIVFLRNFVYESGALIRQYAYVCPYCKSVPRSYTWFARHLHGVHRVKIPLDLRDVVLSRHIYFVSEDPEVDMRNIEYLAGVSIAWSELKIDEKEFIVTLLKRGRIIRAFAWAVRSVPKALLSIDANDVKIDDKNHVVFKIYDVSFEDIKEYYVVAVLDNGLVIINNDGKVVYTEGGIPSDLVELIVNKARSILREKKGIAQETVAKQEPRSNISVGKSAQVVSDDGNEPDWIRDNPWVGIIKNNKKQ